MKSIIKWTLIQRKLSIIWWSFGAFGLIFINMIFYPSFKDQAEEMSKTFENLPEAAVQLFGGSTDFFSEIGFLNSQIYFLMLPMILTILGISLGSSLIAKEEQDKTIENILSRSISRNAFIIGKSLAGLIILTFVTIVSFLTVFLMALVVDLQVSTKNLFLATLACFLLVLVTATVALAVTTYSSASRTLALGVASFVALGGYLISSLSGTVDWLKGPSKLFPFEYYKSEDILRGNIDSINLLILFIGSVVVFFVSVWLFKKRDIY